MEHDAGFRRSTYITLALATLCLVYAELPYLPDFLVWLMPVSVLLACAYVVEGRAVLPAWAANVLAIGSFASVCAWIASRVRAGEDPILQTTPLPTALLPYLGPLLIVLLLVKLFRPKKVGDTWLLQGLGLMEVGLGCVLAGDLVFGGLLLAYLASFAYSLAIFYQLRESTQATPGSAATPRLRPPLARPRPVQTLRWVLGISLAALILFLFTPRPSESQWSSLALANNIRRQASLETGFTSEIDLNRTGRVEINNELAFTVTVTAADGSPKSDLNGNQLWRGSIFDQYHEGRWSSGVLGALPIDIQTHRGVEGMPTNLPIRPNMGRLNPLRDPGHAEPAMPNPFQARPMHWVDLGPSQYFMQITLTPGHSFVLAEPIFFDSGKPLSPVQGMDELANQQLFHEQVGFGALVPLYLTHNGRARYRQVLAPVGEPDVSLPVQLRDDYLAQIDGQTNAGIDEWTDDLLFRLASRPQATLAAEDIAKGPRSSPRNKPVRPFSLPRDKWEKVARALGDYLAHSAEFSYTLDLRRKDPSIDPTLDFLRNVKAGHCERYATALALMLRSQGIPARVLKGYRGAESLDDGVYEVRNSHAHSWVQALIERPPSPPPLSPAPGERSRGEGGALGQRPLHWLALDPTSATEAPAAASFSWSLLWGDFQKFFHNFWSEFIVEYNPDRQTTMAATLWEKTSRSWLYLCKNPRLLVVLTAVALLPLGWLGLRRRARRRGSLAAAPSGPWFPPYERLLALVERHCGLRPGTGQTAREFSFAAQEALLAKVDFVQAGVPAEVIGAYYRVRFGGHCLGDGELARLTHRLDGLETSLRQTTIAPSSK